MNRRRALFIVIRPGHVPLIGALIDHENDLRRDLRAQKRRLVEADLFPLGEVLWRLDELDGSGRLAVRRVRVVREAVHEGVVWVDEGCAGAACVLRARHEVLGAGRGSGVEQRVDVRGGTGASCVRCRLGLGRVCAGAGWG